MRGRGAGSAKDLAPTALAAAEDGHRVFVACAEANEILVLSRTDGVIMGRIPVPLSPSGLVLSRDGRMLYVTCAGPASKVCVVDTEAGRCVTEISTGHTAMGPVLSPDGRTLYVCQRFDNDVAFIDLISGSVSKRVAVAREPVAAAITPDGQFLLVANHIHTGRSDADQVASSITVIDTLAGKVVKEVTLPNGSGMLRDVRVSPDGQYACVTHLVSRFHLPTSQIERGWINANALTLIDVSRMATLNTVLLDSVDNGAANPWAAAWSTDGRFICVTHAGTHELSVIDWPGLRAKLAKVAEGGPGEKNEATFVSHAPADVPNDLAFLVGVRTRIKLPEKDRGPRAVILVGGKAWVADYFSDSLSLVDFTVERPRAKSLALGGTGATSPVRRGEALFNDAAICFQGWQSCASCHSSDGRVDGLNWDNLNDGIGNPKNVKSLLLAHRTPPSMAMGVREDAEYAVRAGIRHSLFMVRPEHEAADIDTYLMSLEPIPSPFLVDGHLSAAAERGKQLFFDEMVGCADCHRPPLYTNLKSYDAGTMGKFDKPGDKFDTPTLIELWRTAPYLHDGRAATVEEVFTTWNKDDKRGKTSHLTREQIADLAAFVLSL